MENTEYRHITGKLIQNTIDGTYYLVYDTSIARRKLGMYELLTRDFYLKAAPLASQYKDDYIEVPFKEIKYATYNDEILEITF